MQGAIIGNGSEEYDRIWYKSRVTKTGCIIARTKQHVTATPTSVEDYLRN